MFSAELDGLGSANDFEQHADRLDHLQSGDLLFCDLLDMSVQSQDGDVGSSTQHQDIGQATQCKTEAKRIVSNRKAQQRFRQKQKVKKAAETSELKYLRERVRQLEQLRESPTTLAPAVPARCLSSSAKLASSLWPFATSHNCALPGRTLCRPLSAKWMQATLRGSWRVLVPCDWKELSCR